MTCTKYIKLSEEATQLLPPLFHTAIDSDGVGRMRENKNVSRLEVKPLWRALLLLVQNVLLGLFEVFVGDFHSALSQSHEACFCADGLEDERRKHRESNKSQTGGKTSTLHSLKIT